MEMVDVVKISLGEFRIKNILNIGEENEIAVAKSVLSQGMYGYMAASKIHSERKAASDIFAVAELNGRILNAPEDIKDVGKMSRKNLDELWEAWTKQSGMFLNPKVSDDDPSKDEKSDSDTGKAEGEGKD